LSSEFSADELQDDVENIGYEIFGGWNVAKGAHPWFARIEVDKDDPALEPSVCGGTLIRNNVVLTGKSLK
jgi:secreted trypsin-like serine protease